MNISDFDAYGGILQTVITLKIATSIIKNKIALK
jgi:hypothetical protein